MVNLEWFKKRIVDLKIDKVFFASSKPHPINIKKFQLTEGARLIIPLSGTKNLLIGDGKNIVELSLKTGEVVCIPPFCWDRPLWNSPHEMISVVFRTKCLRLIYIKNNPETDPEFPIPNFIYHLIPGPSNATFYSMQSLLNTNRNIYDDDLLSTLTKSVLRLINYDLEQVRNDKTSKAFSKCLELSEYVQNHLQGEISRRDVADIFKISPQHVSYLFKTFLGKSFSDFLTECRINHATILLLKTNMTVDEIAAECNYGYTSHFIKMFKRRHGIPPAKYRIARRNKNPELS